jgi:general secretion pathway protein H
MVSRGQTYRPPVTLMPVAPVIKRSFRREAPRVKAQSGFTVLELLVVLTLVTVMMAVVPPLLFGGISGAELKGSARKLAAGLKYARNHAITNNGEAVFILDLDRRRFGITGRQREYALPDDIEVSMVTARSELDAEHIGKIRFFPDGTSTGGRITLVRGERSYAVDVNWLTGQVVIFD